MQGSIAMQIKRFLCVNIKFKIFNEFILIFLGQIAALIASLVLISTQTRAMGVDNYAQLAYNSYRL